MLAHLPKYIRRGAVTCLSLTAGFLIPAAAEDAPPAPPAVQAPEEKLPMPPELLNLAGGDDHRDGGNNGSKSEVPGADGHQGPRPGKDRRGMSPERLQDFWNSLSEAERKRFTENKDRWDKMPPDEKREMIQRYMRSIFRVNKEVEQILEQSGAEFTDERKEKFTEEYLQKRRELEHDIAMKMEQLRSEGIPKILDEMRGEYPELGDTQFTDIGKRKRDKDGADGLRPDRMPDGLPPRPPGAGFGPPGTDADGPPGPMPLFPTGNGPGRPQQMPPPGAPPEDAPPSVPGQ